MQSDGGAVCHSDWVHESENNESFPASRSSWVYFHNENAILCAFSSCHRSKSQTMGEWKEKRKKEKNTEFPIFPVCYCIISESLCLVFVPSAHKTNLLNFNDHDDDCVRCFGAIAALDRRLCSLALHLSLFGYSSSTGRRPISINVKFTRRRIYFVVISSLCSSSMGCETITVDHQRMIFYILLSSFGLRITHTHTVEGRVRNENDWAKQHLRKMFDYPSHWDIGLIIVSSSRVQFIRVSYFVYSFAAAAKEKIDRFRVCLCLLTLFADVHEGAQSIHLQNWRVFRRNR